MGIQMDADRIAEARVLKMHYQVAKAREPSLRHKILANGLGVASSAVAGWFNGHARCPDQALLWLAERLDFDAASVRPDIHARIGLLSEQEQARARLHELVDTVDERRLGEISRYIRFILQTRN